jgi:hypothetical protein
MVYIYIDKIFKVIYWHRSEAISIFPLPRDYLLIWKFFKFLVPRGIGSISKFFSPSAAWYWSDIAVFQSPSAARSWSDIKNIKFLWRVVLEVILLHGFQTPSYQIRTKHNVIEPKQTQPKLKCFDFLRRFLHHGVRFLILTAFVIPISSISKSHGAWLWSESEICLSLAVLVSGTKAKFSVLRCVVVVGKRLQLFSAYGMCRAIHPLPPYNTYLYIPFTLQRVSYTWLMRQFRVWIPWIHMGTQKIFVEVRRCQLALHDRIDIPNYTMEL